MAITDDLRKTLSDPTPLYFAAGTADLAYQQAKKVPALVEQLRSEAPARFEAVRSTDPKAVQEKAAARAKEAGARVRETQETFQTRVTEFMGSLDSDLKKFGETAQDLALRGVGVAAEYAVKARETYEKVAEHGEQTVRTWRGQAAEGIEDVAEEVEELAIAVEPKSEPVAAKAEPKPAAAESESAPAKKAAAAKKPVARKTTAKKTAPPAQ
ncbi:MULTISPECIES: hypothetical protein [unclassified Streptomyces]|uniref:hypothetical protein n=1 Tax=unclassified Streptomyces TaxID=2593676 RepID=UPI001F042B51|nr:MULTISPECIES: hypothetical protein [unclassified Streptomyces]MCH0566077.1 hypothetical protein [Streptomyces sp. MUM 2J]MCH0567929.1 hypothetical protein [Streptomyces sp. MUM 136J]